MAISLDKLDDYSSAYLAKVNEKKKRIESLKNELGNKKKVSYGYVPKMVADYLSGTKQYEKELNSLEAIKILFSRLCEFDVKPIKFDDVSLESIKNLVASLSENEKNEIVRIILSTIHDINSKKIDDFTKLKSNLLKLSDIVIGQGNIVPLTGNLQPFMFEELVDAISSKKHNEFRQGIIESDYNFNDKTVSLGSYGLYEILDAMEKHISSQNDLNDNPKFSSIARNFDEIKRSVIELQRVTNCNNYLIVVIDILKKIDAVSFASVIQRLKDLLIDNYKHYEDLNTKVNSYQLEDFVSEIYGDKRERRN